MYSGAPSLRQTVRADDADARIQAEPHQRCPVVKSEQSQPAPGTETKDTPLTVSRFDQLRVAEHLREAAKLVRAAVGDWVAASGSVEAEATRHRRRYRKRVSAPFEPEAIELHAHRSRKLGRRLLRRKP